MGPTDRPARAEKAEIMSLFGHREFDDHQEVAFCADADSGLRAIIAIHNTNRGPSLGGCRMWPYAAEEEALTDVLRLSRGMTYKAAVAELPLGGGKSVIIGDPRIDKTEALLRAMVARAHTIEVDRPILLMNNVLRGYASFRASMH